MLLLAAALALQAAPAAPPPGELSVDPYTRSNANAGAPPFAGDRMLRAFHGKAGIDHIVDDLVDHIQVDPRISEILKGQDMVRLRRMLKEQFCYILDAGCDYTGRTMQAAHKDMGIQTADVNALIENLQAAMHREHVGFFAQNQFLAKLAPMKRTTVKQ
ncbi:MAG: bacterial-like globin family protein [Sphingomonas bacterium]|uniref:group I truncated hemoglobin n=1 Tax=Sphingomonas bacterium TaxID=1895847 RepID=UPI00261B3599|nr:group 1 truncated hemoglobin [Sphingomonas bacterium]MDB5712198.1 bacterial-like globin family protein [Sphingomonas bacterium]